MSRMIRKIRIQTNKDKQYQNYKGSLLGCSFFYKPQATMPLICIKDIDSCTRLGLWKIGKDENLEDFCPLAIRPSLYKLCAARRTETAAVYAILKAMERQHDFVICHEPSGKPFLQKEDGSAYKCYISVSHTYGYACLMMSSSRPVAIDIEYRSNRVSRIVERFMRKDELEECNSNNCETILTRQLIYWCAKETAYKLYSDKNLTFQQIRISSIGGTIKREGEFQCQNMIYDEISKFKYWQNEDFVMTYR